MIKHGKTSKSVFSILLTTCSLLAGAVPIMAYQHPVLDNSGLYEASDFYSAKSVEIFVPDGAEFPEEYDYLNLPEEPVFFDKGNDYFIADDGEIYYFSSDPESYAACKHTYKFSTRETIISSLMTGKSIIFLLTRSLTPPASIRIKQDIPTDICHMQI